MLDLKISISYNIMQCSNIRRCDKPILISFENIYICRNCSAIFQKGNKYIKDILINCCNNRNINKTYNIPFCNNCLTLCVHKGYI